MRASLVRCLVLGAVLAGSGACGSAPPTAEDFPSFRAAALAALGGDVETLAFRGSGWDACLGQAWSVAEGWARWELTGYERVIDYAAGTSTQTAMRRAGLDADRVGGCGAQVNAAPSRQQSVVRAGASFADGLPITLTPHGVFRLAATSQPAVARSADGYTLTFDVPGDTVTHAVVADYDADHLPRRIRTWIDDPVLGDMEVAADLDGFRDFGGVTFPGTLEVTQGGHTTLALTVDGVEAGVAPPEIATAPARGGGARGGGAGGRGTASGPAYAELGNGVYVMLGAYQGVAVEFDDFAVVVDGMQNDARTAEIIRLTHERMPGKPIRFAVNTHSHFDHASGLRQYAAEGATILTHETNVPFFQAALSAPRTLTVARIEPARVEADVQAVTGRRVIEDASGQRLELIPLGPSPHAADMLVAWLPAIRTIVESDLLQPWINPVFAGDGPGPHPYLTYLHDELEREQPDYEWIVSVHTPPEPPRTPRSVLDEAVGR